jgi:hypothetical protein
MDLRTSRSCNAKDSDRNGSDADIARRSSRTSALRKFAGSLERRKLAQKDIGCVSAKGRFQAIERRAFKLTRSPSRMELAFASDQGSPFTACPLWTKRDAVEAPAFIETRDVDRLEVEIVGRARADHLGPDISARLPHQHA